MLAVLLLISATTPDVVLWSMLLNRGGLHGRQQQLALTLLAVFPILLGSIVWYVIAPAAALVPVMIISLLIFLVARAKARAANNQG